MYIASEKRSREAGRLTFLTANEFLAVVNRAAACELTGIPFDTATGRNGRRRPFAPSMDRIDCSKGYIAGNVRLVALIVNCALGDFGEEAFEVAATAFLKARAGAVLPRAGADTRERFSDAA